MTVLSDGGHYPARAVGMAWAPDQAGQKRSLLQWTERPWGKGELC